MCVHCTVQMPRDHISNHISRFKFFFNDDLKLLPDGLLLPVGEVTTAELLLGPLKPPAQRQQQQHNLQPTVLIIDDSLEHAAYG